MRIHIEPVPGLLGETANYFSCDNHRVVDGNIVSTLAFWNDGGRKLAERDATLSPEQYTAWCQLSEQDEDGPYFLAAHMETLGLTAMPPAPYNPDTPEQE